MAQNHPYLLYGQKRLQTALSPVRAFMDSAVLLYSLTGKQAMNEKNFETLLTLSKALEGADHPKVVTNMAQEVILASLIEQMPTFLKHNVIVDKRNFDDLLNQRLQGLSLSRVLGQRAFLLNKFEINEYVLEPTDKAETLAVETLRFLTEDEWPKEMLELGVGSGAILVSAVSTVANVRGVGIDISDQALEIASHNAMRHGVADRTSFMQGSWFEPLVKSGRKFDLIVSNPPYLSPEEIQALPADKRNEPYLAFDGGMDGLDHYKIIINQARQYLKKNGCLMVEIGSRQADNVMTLMRGNHFVPKLVYDFYRKPRVIIGVLQT